MRIGIGYDIHRFAEGRRLVLGGVEIPHTHGLDGHSDADCLTHALSDAILGALGLPDIGHFLPNDNPDIAGIDSQRILQRATEEAHQMGYRVVNADLAIIAEKPKLAPHLDDIKVVLARSLRIDMSQIGLKATTNEGIGDLGRAMGIAAHAVVLLERHPDAYL